MNQVVEQMDAGVLREIHRSMIDLWQRGYALPIRWTLASFANPSAVVSGKTAENKDSELILSPEQKAELEKFQAQKLSIRKELRQVRRSLDERIDALGTRLKLVNIGLMPLLITLFALGFAFWKRKSRAG